MSKTTTTVMIFADTSRDAAGDKTHSAIIKAQIDGRPVKLHREAVRELARALVKEFEDEPESWTSPTLRQIAPLEAEGDFAATWQVEIVEANAE